MRCADRALLAAALLAFCALPSSAQPRADALPRHYGQRYAMGTMFDILVDHPSRADAARAVEQALNEIERLDRVMSDYKIDSDLSRLNRAARTGFVAVDPGLYEVIETAAAFSRRSNGTFDVTIAPLLRVWKAARDKGRAAPASAVAEAARCVGYDKIELRAPDLIRFRSDCLEIDLGAIGKGYAVDRALGILAAAGIRHALINAGGSSIAAIGAPAGRNGWPVRVGAARIVELRDASISTSQQNLVPLSGDAGAFGEIIDPHTGAPAPSTVAVTVIAPTATASDALDTTLVMLSREAGTALLAEFADVSAFWIAPSGEIQASYGESRVRLAASR